MSVESEPRRGGSSSANVRGVYSVFVLARPLTQRHNVRSPFISPSTRTQTSSPSTVPLRRLHFFSSSWSMSQARTYFIFSNKPAIITKPTPQPVLILPPHAHEHPPLPVCYQTSIPPNSSPVHASGSYHPCSPRCVTPSPLVMPSRSSIAISSLKTLLSQMVGTPLLTAAKNAKSSSNSLTLGCRQLMLIHQIWIAAAHPT